MINLEFYYRKRFRILIFDFSDNMGKKIREIFGKSRVAIFFSNDLYESGGLKNNFMQTTGTEIAIQQGNRKLVAVVARSIFSNQNNISGSDRFLKFKCRKITHC